MASAQTLLTWGGYLIPLARFCQIYRGLFGTEVNSNNFQEIASALNQMRRVFDRQRFRLHVVSWPRDKDECQIMVVTRSEFLPSHTSLTESPLMEPNDNDKAVGEFLQAYYETPVFVAIPDPLREITLDKVAASTKFVDPWGE
jgi:hypothetical protein